MTKPYIPRHLKSMWYLIVGVFIILPLALVLFNPLALVSEIFVGVWMLKSIQEETEYMLSRKEVCYHD